MPQRGRQNTPRLSRAESHSGTVRGTWTGWPDAWRGWSLFLDKLEVFPLCMRGTSPRGSRDRGGRDVGVAEQDLNDPGVDAVFQQTGRVAVAQTVGCEAMFDPGGDDRASERLAQHDTTDRSRAVTFGKQPARIAMGPPVRGCRKSLRE